MYVIDGYNVVHASSVLRPIMLQNLESAREALVDKVTDLCAATGQRALLVFDGRGEHQAETVEHFRGVNGLTVQYAPRKSSADTVIERYVYQASNRREIVVVSSDRGLRDACRNMGTLVMDADNFIRTVREIREENVATRERPRKDERPAHLEDRLSGDSMARLKDLRDRL